MKSRTPESFQTDILAKINQLRNLNVGEQLLNDNESEDKLNAVMITVRNALWKDADEMDTYSLSEILSKMIKALQTAVNDFSEQSNTIAMRELSQSRQLKLADHHDQLKNVLAFLKKIHIYLEQVNLADKKNHDKKIAIIQEQDAYLDELASVVVSNKLNPAPLKKYQ
jgi:hypothetical protein